MANPPCVANLLQTYFVNHISVTPTDWVLKEVFLCVCGVKTAPDGVELVSRGECLYQAEERIP